MSNNTKICNKCQIDKNISCFSKGKRFADGLQIICKDCARNYRENNKIAITLSKKVHYENNRDDILQYHKNYYQKNKEDITLVQKEYRKNHKIEIADYNNKYYFDNKISIVLQHKEYYENNKDKIVAIQKEYYENHKNEVDNYRREYYKNRLQNDLIFKIKRRISSQVWHSLFKNGLSKNNKSICDFLPYSIQELKDHLESLFEPWMNWGNYGRYVVKDWNDNDFYTWKWQIDHIVPHSQFKYVSMEDQSFRDCWALSNLRPYSAKQNLLDSDRK